MIMCKKVLASSVFVLFALLATAQVKVRWGNIDTRYPLESGAVIKTTPVNNAVAWRG